jgi:hypothetical protein
MQSDEYSYRQSHHKEGAILSRRFVSLSIHPLACLISWTETYFISGRQESLQSQEIEYQVHTLRFRAEQCHDVQLDHSFVPTPSLSERLSHTFRVSSDTIVK